MIGDDDFGVFFNPDDFATSADWAGVTVNGILTAPAVDLLVGEGAGVVSAPPVFVIAAADQPSGAAQGDAVTINGGAYRVAKLEPDAAGLVRVLLERS